MLSHNMPSHVLTTRSPVSLEDWFQYFDDAGTLLDEATLRRQIFYGGVDDAVRRHAWKFLLGYFPLDSNAKARHAFRSDKAKEYAALKTQWQSITPAQERRFRKFRERRSFIDKDVVRTDRTHAFFKDEDGEHLTWMREILLTYTFYNFDLGYCQGMSDLLGPILTIMNDEVDGFWCFAGMMESMVRVGHGHDCHHDTTPQPHHTALQPHPHPTTH